MVERYMLAGFGADRKFSPMALFDPGCVKTRPCYDSAAESAGRSMAGFVAGMAFPISASPFGGPLFTAQRKSGGG